MSSVVIKSHDPAAIARAVADYVACLRAGHPEIRRVIWFGSRTTGIPLPGSDVDLCLVLSSSDKPARSRMVDYLPVGFPVGIDLFAYTEAEFAALPEQAPGWHAAIMSGREI